MADPVRARAIDENGAALLVLDPDPPVARKAGREYAATLRDAGADVVLDA